MDQIDTIERIKTILKYGVKYKDQIRSLPYNYNINLKIMKKKKRHIDKKRKKERDIIRELLSRVVKLQIYYIFASNHKNV